MVARAPRVLGWLYDAMDKPFHQDRMLKESSGQAPRGFSKRFANLIADVAICTHFLPTALLDRERRKGDARVGILTVVTDFEVHGMWLGAPSGSLFRRD